LTGFISLPNIDSMLASLIRKNGLRTLVAGRHARNGGENTHLHQEGRKPEDGPPDIEQLWRDFNRRLNRLFGGDGGPGSGRRGTGIAMAIIVAVVVFLWLVSGLFIVQEGQTGVVMAFGKFDHLAQPGLNWHWPYPIQSHEIVNISEARTIEIGYSGNAKNKQAGDSLMLTADENIVDTQIAVQYKIVNATDWVFNNSDPEETVKEAAESAIQKVIGRSTMETVLYGDRKQATADIRQLMQQTLDKYRIGAQVSEVSFQGIRPPEPAQAAFDDAVKAEQDRERQRSDGQAYANDIILRAKGPASRLIEEAEAYNARVVDNAEGDALRFKQILAEYQKAPGVTRDRMYLETMQQIFANTTKVVTDSKAGSNLIYLPLDKLLPQASQATEAETSAPKAASSTPPTVGSAPAQENVQTVESSHPRTDGRGREDSRERESR
jgi:membrane protease subunit HflK